MSFTLPLTASPHTEGGGGEAHGHSRRSQRGAHTANRHLPSLVHRPRRRHTDKDDDHLHEATPALMPCIALERITDGTGSIQHYPAAVELGLVHYQHRTGDDIWLYIGDGSRGMDISLESARRLVRVLGRYIHDER